MRHQPEARHAADEEGEGQHPEHRAARRGAHGGDADGEGVFGRRRGRRQHRLLAKGRQAEIRGTVAREQHEGDSEQADHENRRQQGVAPAIVLGEPGGGRQEDQLTRGGARAEDAHHQAAVPGEPAGRDGRRQHQRGHAGRDAENDAEAQPKLPLRRHGHGPQQPDDHQHRRAGEHRARPVAQDQRAGERGNHAEQRHAQPERPRQVADRPAELARNRHQQRSGDARDR